jgi:hypothetical protein
MFLANEGCHTSLLQTKLADILKTVNWRRYSNLNWQHWKSNICTAIIRGSSLDLHFSVDSLFSLEKLHPSASYLLYVLNSSHCINVNGLENSLRSPYGHRPPPQGTVLLGGCERIKISLQNCSISVHNWSLFFWADFTLLYCMKRCSSYFLMRPIGEEFSRPFSNFSCVQLLIDCMNAMMLLTWMKWCKFIMWYWHMQHAQSGVRFQYSLLNKTKLRWWF